MSGDRSFEDTGMVETGTTPVMGNAIEVNKCMLSDHMGMVCITFEHRTDALTLNPQEALTMGEALQRQAYRARFGDFPDGKKKQGSEQLRIRMINRVEIILRKPITSKIDERARAAAVVDEVMKNVG